VVIFLYPFLLGAAFKALPVVLGRTLYLRRLLGARCQENDDKLALRVENGYLPSLSNLWIFLLLLRID